MMSSSVQVITRQTMEEQGAQTLSDAGIQLIHSSAATGREAVSIRGFDSRFSMILIIIGQKWLLRVSQSKKK
ncbi:MAG: Plug domain-containing protein [Smithella sp.]